MLGYVTTEDPIKDQLNCCLFETQNYSVVSLFCGLNRSRKVLDESGQKSVV